MVFESWESELRIEATNDGSHVDATVTLRASGEATWALSAEIVVDPGEQMLEASRVAAALFIRQV